MKYLKHLLYLTILLLAVAPGAQAQYTGPIDFVSAKMPI